MRAGALGGVASARARMCKVHKSFFACARAAHFVGGLRARARWHIFSGHRYGIIAVPFDFLSTLAARAHLATAARARANQAIVRSALLSPVRARASPGYGHDHARNEVQKRVTIGYVAIYNHSSSLIARARAYQPVCARAT